VSPSGTGLKIFVRIKSGNAGYHEHYFVAIAHYLSVTYGVTADRACKDISRACFLCHDADALFSDSGFVHSDHLLCISPPVVADAAPFDSSAFAPVKKPRNDQYSPPETMSYMRYQADCLLQLPCIHTMAERALLEHGWQKRDMFWLRPGKEWAKGHSAIYNQNGSGVYIFTCFSDAALPFIYKGYTDLGIISLLYYNGDYKYCVDDLAHSHLTH
jgi:hypothetical protein